MEKRGRARVHPTTTPRTKSKKAPTNYNNYNSCRAAFLALSFALALTHANWKLAQQLLPLPSLSHPRGPPTFFSTDQPTGSLALSLSSCAQPLTHSLSPSLSGELCNKKIMIRGGGSGGAATHSTQLTVENLYRNL